MAAIRETLVLEDRFSAVFSSYLNLGRQISASMKSAAQSQNDFTAAAARSGEALEEMAGAGGQAADAMEQTADASRKMSFSSGGAASGQERLNRAMRGGVSAADSLTSRLKHLAAAYLGLRSAQGLVSLSDTWTQTTARLDRMNDGVQTTPEVQAMIFQSAQRSRGDYLDMTDMVAKLGTLAGDAFGGTAEVAAFAEQINKQFALAGTSAQGAQAAMLQLTQAMSSGVLRGEELNSILEQAPTITKSIADYLGVTVGQMRELASEGKITSDVVKAAVFSAAEETNAAFEAIPLTFSQAMTMVKNEGVNALRPALEELNAFLNSDIGRDALNGFIAAVRLGGEMLVWLIGKAEDAAAFIAENWDTVSTLLIGGALAVAAVMTASAVQTAIAWAAANWPLLLIVGSIVLIIYMARQMGATWEEIAGVVGGCFGLMYAFAMNNFIVPAQNGFARFANFIPNFFEHPLSATKILFLDMADTVLGYLSNVAHGIENLINKIPGLSVNLTSGIDSVHDWVKNASQNVKDASGWKEYVKKWDFVDYANAWEAGSAKGRGIGSALDNFSLDNILGSAGGTPFDYNALAAASGLNSTLSGIGEDTKAIRNSVALSEEDIKLLVDMATREYVNNINLTAQTPIINVTGQNTGDSELDKRALAETLRDILLEQAASSTDLAYTWHFP